MPKDHRHLVKYDTDTLLFLTLLNPDTYEKVTRTRYPYSAPRGIKPNEGLRDYDAALTGMNIANLDAVLLPLHTL